MNIVRRYRSAFVKAQCGFRSNYYVCLGDRYKCYSDEKREEFVSEYDDSFASLEEQIADLLSEPFAWGNCNVLN